MIKISVIEKFLQWTPFTDPFGINYLADNGIKITEHQDADLIVSGNFKRLLLYMPRFGWTKKYLLWTVEPRYDQHFESKIRYGIIPTVHVMNVYTGIFEDNYFATPEVPIEFNYDKFFEFTNKKIVTLMTYQTGPKCTFIHKGKDLDLCNLRTKIALEGYNKKCVDIYGRYWPDGISMSNSRGGNWHSKKIDILKAYHFNLCFENTNWPFYCTEKIWDSIQGGCLPIYYGEGNRIYDDFPKNSFLDYCDFNDVDSLFDYIKNMTPSEFQERMNLCVQAFNQAVKNKSEKQPEKKRLDKTVSKIKEICC